jgi:hypothetical protein
VPGFLDGIDDFLASFSDEERAVSRYLFGRVLAGQAVRPEELGGAIGLRPVAASNALTALRDRGTLLIDEATGEVVGARGLSLRETPHALRLRDRTLYAFCAVDALGIPAALGLDADVTSRCHACRAPLRIAVRGGAVADAASGAVIWAVDRDPCRSLREHT